MKITAENFRKMICRVLKNYLIQAVWWCNYNNKKKRKKRRRSERSVDTFAHSTYTLYHQCPCIVPKLHNHHRVYAARKTGLKKWHFCYGSLTAQGCADPYSCLKPGERYLCRRSLHRRHNNSYWSIASVSRWLAYIAVISLLGSWGEQESPPQSAETDEFCAWTHIRPQPFVGAFSRQSRSKVPQKGAVAGLRWSSLSAPFEDRGGHSDWRRGFNKSRRGLFHRIS